MILIGKLKSQTINDHFSYFYVWTNLLHRAQRLADVEAKKAQKEAAFNEKEAKKALKEEAEVPGKY
jgi:hypothetical protein